MAKQTIGGQAVIEGVMLRSKEHISIAVRKPSGKIKVRVSAFKSWTKRHPCLNWPIIRGVVVLAETVVLGLKMLNYSANESLDEKDEKLTVKDIAITFGVGIVFAVLIFKLLPLLLAGLIVKENIMFNVLDGAIKLGIFVLYLFLISRMKDVRRVFEYHGAEHAAVNCYESGKKVNAANVKKFSTAQQRCGTTFLFFVIFISIIFYIFIPFSYSFWLKLLARLLLLPLIAGVSYELIRIAPKCSRQWWFRILISPGVLLQRLSTRIPDRKQIEVAVKALEGLLKAEKS